MEATVQFLVNTFVPGARYGLAAASFTIVHRVANILNLAHGGVVLVGAYAYFVALERGLSPFGSTVAAVATGAAAACGIGVAVFEPLRARRKSSTVGNLIASFAVLLIIEAILLMVFGSRVLAAPPLFGQAIFTMGGATVSIHQFTIVVAATGSVVLLASFLRWTTIGRAMRAVADHESAAAIVGINPRAIRIWTHALSGAFAGSLLTDAAMNIWTWVGPTALRELAALLLVILVLVFRPWGLFGRKPT